MGQALRLFKAAGISKIIAVAKGGPERQDSVYNALKLLPPGAKTVLVHDGARPFVTPAFIRRLIKALGGFDGVVPALPPKDTIKEVSEKGTVVATLRRDALVSVQTPQVFSRDVLLNAYEKAMASGFYSTDDAALVEALGGKIKVVRGLAENIKITTPEDIAFAEALLKR